MAVEAIANGWKRSGEASYYVIYTESATSNRKYIQGIGYTGSTKYISTAGNPVKVLEPDYTHPVLGISPGGGQNPSRNKLESFLLHLYFLEFSLSSEDEEIVFDLDADMVKNGILDDYSGVKPLDFMVLTQAKRRNYKLPDTGKVKNLAQLGPADERPNLSDVPDIDQKFMINVIKHLGLKGLLPYLFAPEGISFETFADCIKEFFPDDRIDERRAWWVNYCSPTLKALSVPSFTNKQFQDLGIE